MDVGFLALALNAIHHDIPVQSYVGKTQAGWQTAIHLLALPHRVARVCVYMCVCMHVQASKLVRMLSADKNSEESVRKRK